MKLFAETFTFLLPSLFSILVFSSDICNILFVHENINALFFSHHPLAAFFKNRKNEILEGKNQHLEVIR